MLAPLLAETAPAADRSPADVGPSDSGSDKAVRILSVIKVFETASSAN